MLPIPLAMLLNRYCVPGQKLEAIIVEPVELQPWHCLEQCMVATHEFVKSTSNANSRLEDVAMIEVSKLLSLSVRLVTELYG